MKLIKKIKKIFRILVEAFFDKLDECLHEVTYNQLDDENIHLRAELKDLQLDLVANEEKLEERYISSCRYYPF